MNICVNATVVYKIYFCMNEYLGFIYDTQKYNTSEIYKFFVTKCIFFCPQTLRSG
jgi:hypothetical protein